MINLCLVAEILISINNICRNKNLHLLNKRATQQLLFHNNQYNPLIRLYQKQLFKSFSFNKGLWRLMFLAKL